MPYKLASTLAASLDPASRARLPEPRQLDDLLRRLLDEARGNFPGASAPAAELVGQLGRKLAAKPAQTPLLANIRELDIGELFLAVACAADDKVALVAFETRYLAAVDPALARMGLDASTVDDVKQQVRERLLTGAPPRIVHYAGRGELRALVRVVARRAALNLLRRRRYSDVDELLCIPDPGAGPEQGHMRQLYVRDFKMAFEEAMAALEVRDRNLLRMHLIDRLSIDEIAAVYGVHRSTAARRLRAAREFVAAETRRRLGQRHGVTGDELDSIVRLIRSDLDLSLQRVLAVN